VLRRWLRHDEYFIDIEEKTVYICEPDIGRNLSDEEERSNIDIVEWHEDRDEIKNCQEGNEKMLRTKHQYSIEKPQEKYSTP
jgi:hypothetical protein